jgi:hypothetical protein
MCGPILYVIRPVLLTVANEHDRHVVLPMLYVIRPVHLTVANEHDRHVVLPIVVAEHDRH